MTKDPKMLTVTQFAAAAGVNRRTAQSWAREGRVRAVRTAGGHWRLDARDLEQRRLTTGEFAQAVGVCYRTAYRWAAAGKLDAVKTRGGYLIAAGEVAKRAQTKGLTDASRG
jgi:excisionase family DNA binding protein